MALVLCDDAQRTQSLRGELHVRSEQLGSSPEVNGFRVSGPGSPARQTSSSGSRVSNIQIPPGQHFYLRYEARPYRIGDKVCELLLGFERVRNAADVL